MKEELISNILKIIIDSAPDLRRSFSHKPHKCGDIPLSGHHHYCLFILAKHDGLSMSEIASALGVSKQQLTRIIDYLADNGLVERYTAPDNRRVVIAKLTDKGNLGVKEFHELHAVSAKEMLNNLSESELSDLLSHLEGIKAIIAKLKN